MQLSRENPREKTWLESIASLLVVLSVLAPLAGCAASSPHDRSWVTSEIERGVGHRVGDVGQQTTRPSSGTPRFTPSLPPDVSGERLRTITEDEAVSVALWNSVPFQADLAQLGISRADLADAGALPNPTLSFLFPVSTRQLELSAAYPVSALLQRPWRVAVAKLDVERVARSLVQSGLDFVRDVRIAWSELHAARLRRALRSRVDEIVRATAVLASSRLRTGDVSALEADLVKAESLAATELAGRGVHEESIARTRLRMLVGLAESPLGADLAAARDPQDNAGASESEGEDALSKMATTLPPEETLERIALGARPDLRASEIAVELTGERLGLEKSRIVQLFARLDAKPVGSRGGGPLLWIPGFTADIPIFNQNPGGRARANAEIERVALLYLATRQQVLTDVRLAHEELMMAVSSLGPWRNDIVPLQEKNLRAAMKAYEAGADSYLLVLEATRRLLDARLRELDLGLDARRARARLDRAVGWSVRANGQASTNGRPYASQ